MKRERTYYLFLLDYLYLLSKRPYIKSERERLYLKVYYSRLLYIKRETCHSSYFYNSTQTIERLRKRLVLATDQLTRHRCCNLPILYYWDRPSTSSRHQLKSMCNAGADTRTNVQSGRPRAGADRRRRCCVSTTHTNRTTPAWQHCCVATPAWQLERQFVDCCRSVGVQFIQCTRTLRAGKLLISVVKPHYS